MPTEKTWKDDWETFVREVSALFGQGVDDKTVAARFAGNRVVWCGKVGRKCLDVDDAGIQMHMPPIAVKLPDGRHAKVDYLFLNLQNPDIQSWYDVPIGKTLRFSTQISEWIKPFPAIQWWDTGDDNKGVLLFSTDGALPVTDSAASQREH